MRWNLKTSPSRMIVWPALLPPWKRTIASARSASRSTTFPFPSSPHWAPTMQIPGMTSEILGVAETQPLSGRVGVVARTPRVGTPERQDLAHLLEPRDGPVVDLIGQRVALEIRRDDDRALVLVARVDDRVELLEHPRARLLGADVVDVQEVHGGQA